ncbi:hypothetical protein KSP40_PGU018419 [Platanthera guangdongensis]|uniref:Uncharacterized protein n=1 Tax=Platanthera guangdongensis TaxID=2320717 RepID=A0ABR2LUD2_9ASPA
MKWRSEPIDVEKSADELWLGVKCHSNPELAGSPRNALRRSINVVVCGGFLMASRGRRCSGYHQRWVRPGLGTPAKCRPAVNRRHRAQNLEGKPFQVHSGSMLSEPLALHWQAFPPPRVILKVEKVTYCASNTQ